MNKPQHLAFVLRAPSALRRLALTIVAIVAVLVVAPAEARAQCSGGQKLCDGDYCVPSNSTCCGYGNGTYCASDYPVCCGAGSGMCGATSADCSGGGGGGGGGDCPAGQKSCDGNYCVPNDASCCGYGNGTYCNADYPVCCGAGTNQCGATSSDCSGGGSSSGGGPGPGGGDVYCSGASGVSDKCDYIEACCSVSECYYNADGQRFYCNGTYCTSAAQEVVDYCEEKAGGCAMQQAGPFRTSTATLAALFGLMVVTRLRRRSRRRD